MRNWIPLVKQATGEMKLLALKCLLQKLPGFRISVGNSLAAEQGFSGFHWVLSGEMEIPEGKKCPSPSKAPGHSTFSDRLPFVPSVEGTGLSCLLLFAACALEGASEAWVSVALP